MRINKLIANQIKNWNDTILTYSSQSSRRIPRSENHATAVLLSVSVTQNRIPLNLMGFTMLNKAKFCTFFRRRIWITRTLNSAPAKISAPKPCHKCFQFERGETTSSDFQFVSSPPLFRNRCPKSPSQNPPSQAFRVL